MQATGTTRTTAYSVQDQRRYKTCSTLLWSESLFVYSTSTLIVISSALAPACMLSFGTPTSTSTSGYPRFTITNLKCQLVDGNFGSPGHFKVLTLYSGKL